MSEEFKREQRYVVFKRSDLLRLMELDLVFTEALGALTRATEKLRKQDGREPLQCVVVEKDWPEYEEVWKAIEERVRRAPYLEWTALSDYYPVENTAVDTKVEFDGKVTDEKRLERKGDLWFIPGTTLHCFYTPTHWKYIR